MDNARKAIDFDYQKDYKVKANNFKDIPEQCTYLYVAETSTDDNLYISINGKAKKRLDEGFYYRSPEGTVIDKITIYNENSTGQTVGIYWAFGEVGNKNLRLSGSLKIYQGSVITDTAVTLADTAVTEIVNANSNESFRTLQNNGAGNIWVGGESIDKDDKKGFKLSPGASKEFAVNGAIYAQAETSGLSISIQRG